MHGFRQQLDPSWTQVAAIVEALAIRRCTSIGCSFCKLAYGKALIDGD
jgi:hypothetical protein